MFSLLLPKNEHHTYTKALTGVFLFLISALLLMLLVGCASPVPPTVTIFEKVLVSVPPNLTEPIKPQAPLARGEYMAMDIPNREQYMAMYSIELMKSLAQCNNQLSSINKLYGGKP